MADIPGNTGTVPSEPTIDMQGEPRLGHDLPGRLFREREETAGTGQCQDSRRGWSSLTQGRNSDNDPQSDGGWFTFEAARKPTGLLVLARPLNSMVKAPARVDSAWLDSRWRSNALDSQTPRRLVSPSRPPTAT